MSSSAEEKSAVQMEEARNRALLFFLDHLMQKTGTKRTIHDLSCQFGARGFTSEMRDAVGGTQEALTDFLRQFPSLFKVSDDGEIAINALGDLPMMEGVGVARAERDVVQEAIQFFEAKLHKFGPELQIKSLLGHRSQAAPEIRMISGRHLKEFADFLASHRKNFVVEGDRVRLVHISEPEHVDLDEDGMPLSGPKFHAAGMKARQKAVEFLREVVQAEAESSPMAMEQLYQRFCQRFAHSVRQDVACNPKELIQFLKLNRAVFFIRSNKVSLVRMRERDCCSDGGSNSATSESDTNSSLVLAVSSPAGQNVTLVKTLKAARDAVQNISIGLQSDAGAPNGPRISYVCVDFKIVSVGGAEFLSLVIMSYGENVVFFDVSHSDVILLESGLKELLEFGHVHKVAYDNRRACEILSRQHDVQMANVFDAQLAHAIIQHAKFDKPLHEIRPITPQNMRRIYCPDSPAKSHWSPEFSWSERPISDEMVRQAKEGMASLPQIYEILNGGKKMKMCSEQNFSAIPPNARQLFELKSRELASGQFGATMQLSKQKINSSQLAGEGQLQNGLVDKRQFTNLSQNNVNVNNNNNVESHRKSGESICCLCQCHGGGVKSVKSVANTATQTLSTGYITMTEIFYD